MIEAILDFLKTAESEVAAYTSSPDEEHHDGDDDLKQWLTCELKAPIDIRNARADFKSLLFTIGIEAGYEIKRREADPKHPFPDGICPMFLHCIPESGRKLLRDIYDKGMDIIEGKELSGKRARVSY